MQQIGRVYRLEFLGNFNSESKPFVTLYTDYSNTETSLEAATAPGTAKPQLVVKLPKQKVKALKFKISESSGGAAGGGDMRLQSVAMVVGVRGLSKYSRDGKEPVANVLSTTMQGH